MKKRIVFLFMVIMLAASAFAQPTTITWQGKLLDASGNTITQNNVAMTFAMFEASTGGTQLWPTSGVVTKTVDVVQGLYSVQLGTGTGDDIAFTAAMFNGKTPWLEVKVGTETLPRTEITNVPFALISNDLSAAGWENPGEIGKTTPNTGKFTSVETGSVKVTDGASNGKVLTSDADGNATWQNTSLVNFYESNFTYGSRTGVKLMAQNDTASNLSFVIQPKGNGGIIAQQPDGTNTGGDNRGINAIDLQTIRGSNTQVASGEQAVITGGYSNRANGNRSFIGGGFLNTATNWYSVVAGGDANNSTNNWSTVGGGQFNNSSGIYSVIAGGASNMSSQMYSVVSGGYSNTASELSSVVSGGYDNTASGLCSVVPGGVSNNASGKFATTSGAGNIASGQGSTAFGEECDVLASWEFAVGKSISVSGIGATGTGYGNSATGNYSFVTGIGNTAQSEAESIMGKYATIAAVNNNDNDRLIAVGNGTGTSARSNAFTILKNANTTIGGSLTLNGNGTNTSITFPTGRGTGGQFLKTDGAGATSWSGVTKADVGLGNVENTALSTWTGSANITTLGTIATGTWSGTAITVTKGGTGATNKAAGFDALSPMTNQGDIIYGGASGTGTRLGKGTAGQLLAINAGATAPEWKSFSKSDIGLGSVENTALSTWAGSANITTVGTIATGTWHGTAISESYVGSLGTSKITSGTFENARINWAAPGTIGSTTPSTGAFTSLSANNGLTVSSGTVNIKPAGSGGTSGQVLTTDGAGNATWQAATGGVTTLSMRYIICASGYFPSGEMDTHFVGEVILFAGPSQRIPENFVECNGQSLAVASYSVLYSVIGNTYGGNTSNFNVPNLTNKVPKGL